MPQRLDPYHTAARPGRRMIARIAATLAAGALGAGAALAVGACGEDREGGSVENIGGAMTGTTPGTTATEATTGPETTGESTAPETTGSTEAE